MAGKQTAVSVIALSVSLLFSLFASTARAQKPLPPLRVSIVPVEAGITPNQIKPGDVVDFRVEAVSFVDADDLSIRIELTGGAELMTGDLSWRGSVKKNQEKVLLLTVKVPAHGVGAIDARVIVNPRGKGRFTTGTRYVLGISGPASKPGPEHPVKKDSRGRNVIEYR